MNRIGLRLEDKNAFERRVVLTPAHAAKLVAAGIPIDVERFPRRAFADDAYAAAGASVVDDVRACDLVLGVKEMPHGYFRPGGAYMFFSHTIKGQAHNMEMLAELVDKRCTLLDYELVTDEAKRRLIFFGRFAGIAGMIDTLSLLGRRLEVLGLRTPFLDIRPTHAYADLEAAKQAVAAVGARIAAEGIPAALAPLAFGFTGYGHVSKGAQEVFDLLPHVQVEPAALGAFVAGNRGLVRELVKAEYHEQHLVQPVDPAAPFVLQEYYDHPERYRSIFEPQLRLLSVLMNGIFWAPRYPRLADALQLEALFASGRPRLVAVGDVSCDVDGSLACTVRDTDPGDPVYVYDPKTRSAASGVEGPGLAVMAVGNLPAELPVEASQTFSDALFPFMPEIARADFGGSLESLAIPEPIKRSIILWRGEFAPAFQYMRGFLRQP